MFDVASILLIATGRLKWIVKVTACGLDGCMRWTCAAVVL